ncbi:MAG: hypothetical protein IPH13_15275 [Planctomycetes bacterium]|nr:hypothetical protein [Planctomycetota bacterium]MCC7172133.1 hypothetical protein [Planctomycetota bacterium]
MKRLPAERWSTLFSNQSETGMGFWTADVVLADGRVFRDVIIESGTITKIRGRDDIPFEGADVARIEITNRRWDWRE